MSLICQNLLRAAAMNPPSLSVSTNDDASGRFDRLLSRASSPKQQEPAPAIETSKKAKPIKTDDTETADDASPPEADEAPASEDQPAEKTASTDPASKDDSIRNHVSKKPGGKPVQPQKPDGDPEAAEEEAPSKVLHADGSALSEADAETTAVATDESDQDVPAQKKRPDEPAITLPANLPAPVSSQLNAPPGDAQTADNTGAARQTPAVIGDAGTTSIAGANHQPADAELLVPTNDTDAISDSVEQATNAQIDSVTDAKPQTVATTNAPKTKIENIAGKAKKASITPGQMRPVPQGPSNPVLSPVNPVPAGNAASALTNATVSQQSVDSADATDRGAQAKTKASTEISLDPTQILATDKPAAHSPTQTFSSVLNPTSAADAAASNHDKIVQIVKSDLTPNGGTMKIRLDPPELGALQVTVKMTDGVMTASFETSTDQATKMLSHSLAQLKDALESSGISVEKLHVQQTPKDASSNNNGSGNDSRREHAQSSDEGSQQRDQQRKEMIRRMWAKLGVGDPLDLVA